MKSRILLVDVNVWLAYVVASHPFHAQAITNWTKLENDELAFCRVTQMGLLRILTQPKAMGAGVLSVADAWVLYDKLVEEQDVIFLDEPQQMEGAFRLLTVRDSNSWRDWTDAYLAAFARKKQAVLLTFDQGFRKYKHVEVVTW